MAIFLHTSKHQAGATPAAGSIPTVGSRIARSWMRSRSRRRYWVDLFVLVSFGISAYWASSHFELFERFVDYSRKHEGWELDEVVTAIILFSAGGGLFAFRRSTDLWREVRSREDREAQILRMALHDPLTGLANRRKMFDDLGRAIRARKHGDEVTGMLLIDLDRFKPINDMHGHGVGDRLLKAVAERLQASLRDGELVARLGGDEFGIVLPRLLRSEDAGRPARRILKAMEEPFRIDRLALRVGVSVGVAVTADQSADPDALVHHADVALYRAKREGRGEFRYFEENMDSEIRARAKLELEFRQAVLDDAITPYYHPLVELATGRVKGYELLARWIHPEEGVISPEIFIPIAEDTGMIGEMCLRLLAKACAVAVTWPDNQILAVNISPSQLRDTQLPGKLMTVLHDSGFPASRLEVEITESALVDDFDLVKKTLLEFKAYGAQIALDDFGTGYSSLHHLRELPFDVVKIDRSFIMSMAESEESRTIVDAIIALSHSLGLAIVAEGIENVESLERLADLGCEFGQGFLYGEPHADARSFARKVSAMPMLPRRSFGGLGRILAECSAPILAGQ